MYGYRLGLGTLYKTDPSSGTVIDCDLWANLFQGVCWNPFAPSVVPASPSSSGGGSGDGSIVAAVPAVPAPSDCTSTIVSGVCDTTIYIGFGAVALFGILLGMTKK